VLQSLLAGPRGQGSGLSVSSAAYVAQLLAAFEQEGKRTVHWMPHQDTAAPGPAPLGAAAAIKPLLEQLTRREQEVLRLLVAGASNSEIAAELVISMATVKKHVSNILGKLGLANRTQVIARAREWSHLF
jgi:LuxR family maltose regulon positive regulatory protein